MDVLPEERKRLAVVIEGGRVKEVITDSVELSELYVLVIDYDVENVPQENVFKFEVDNTDADDPDLYVDCGDVTGNFEDIVVVPFSLRPVFENAIMCSGG